MLAEAALPRAIELYCASGSSEDERVQGLNTVILQLHRGQVAGLDQLVAGHLRPYLTSEEGYVRMRGTKLLAQILQRLPDMKLPDNVMGAVVRFLSDRFKSDYESAGPCLAALKSVLELHESEFAPGMVAPLAKCVLGSHHVPAMTQSLRYLVYQIMQVLMERKKYSQALLSGIPGSQLVGMFADAMEGEKDPRCLLVSLRVAAMLLREEDGARFDSIEAEQLAVERLFDVSCVYFPIVFRPPINDPFKISAENLWDALHGVFKSHPYMASQVIGLLVDKLNINSGDVAMAKIDSLKTLQVCLPAYGCQVIAPHLETLRTVLLRLVLKGDESAVQEEAARSVGVVASLLAKEEEVLQSFKASKEEFSQNWKDFVGFMGDECTGLVAGSVDSMTGYAAGRLLASIAQSSSIGFSFVLAKALKNITKWCVRPDASETQRTAAFSLLDHLLNAINPDIDFPEEHQPLKKEYVDEIFSILKSEIARRDLAPLPSSSSSSSSLSADGSGPAAMEVDNGLRARSASHSAAATQTKAISALLKLVIRPPSPLVSAAHVTEAVDAWTALLQDSHADDPLRAACVGALVHAGKTKVMCAEAISSATVPLFSQSTNIVSQNLGILTELCAIPLVFDSTMPRMLDPARALELDPKLLGTIADIVVANRSYSQGLEKCCLPMSDASLLVPALLSRVNAGSEIGADGERIIRTICQSISEDAQTELVSATSSSILSNADTSEKMAVATAILGSLRPSVLQGQSGLHDTIRSFAAVAVDLDAVEASPLRCEYAAQCMASLVNKLDGDQALAESLSNQLLDGCRVGAPPKSRAAHLGALIWLAKALIMRGHPLSGTLAEQITAFLRDDDAAFASQAAAFFGVVIKPCDSVLNRDCFAKEGLFFQQRFFGNTFKSIQESYAALPPDSPTKAVFLLAAVKLIEHLPHGIMLSENVSLILPLLVQALASDSLETRASALSSLSIIVENKLELVEPHLFSLAPVLLELSSFATGLKARHRALAIDCLFRFSSLPYNKIHSVRNKVTRQLLPALDDPKRGIRARAVKCRNAWVVLQNV